MPKKEVTDLRQLEDDGFELYYDICLSSLKDMENLCIVSKIEGAIQSGNTSKEAIDSMYRFKNTEKNFDSLQAEFENVSKDAGEISQEYIEGEYFFTTDNKHTQKMFDNIIAERVTNINKEVRKSLKICVSEAFDKGRPARKTAKEIVKHIGLNSIQNAKYINLRDELEKNGATQKQIEKELKKYYNKAIKYRSEMIARTELAEATNRTQTTLWQDADDQGFIDNGTKKRWFAIIDKRTSPVCKFLNGKKVAWNTDFVAEDGRKISSPPAHINCRSGQSLVFE